MPTGADAGFARAGQRRGRDWCETADRPGARRRHGGRSEDQRIVSRAPQRAAHVVSASIGVDPLRGAQGAWVGSNNPLARSVDRLRPLVEMRKSGRVELLSGHPIMNSAGRSSSAPQAGRGEATRVLSFEHAKVTQQVGQITDPWLCAITTVSYRPATRSRSADVYPAGCERRRAAPRMLAHVGVDVEQDMTAPTRSSDDLSRRVNANDPTVSGPSSRPTR